MTALGKSALPQRAWRELETIGNADIVVGVPSYNCAQTINYVVYQAARGLEEHFSDLKALILVSDGNSTDGTLKVVKAMRTPGQAKIVATRYVGVPGKGTALRAVFEAASFLDADGIAVVDSDLRSITPEWIRLLISPTLRERAGLVTPLYLRHKYDGTITNFVCYPFTCSLYGKRVRQPIGGDFGLSKELVETLLTSPLWSTAYVPGFGIDIFETHHALARGFLVKQAFLGSKIHEIKDPSRQLALMFMSVVGSMFCCMESFEDVWKPIQGSHPVEVIRGEIEPGSPEPVRVSPHDLIKAHKAGFHVNRNVYGRVLSRELLREIENLQKASASQFVFPSEAWAKMMYSFAGAFKREKDEGARRVLLDALRVLWMGRVAGFILETLELSGEEAEEKIQREARVFEDIKPYLLDVYQNGFQNEASSTTSSF